MADAKLTALTAATSIAGTDIIYTVVDPGGTPLPRKITAANVAAYINGVAANRPGIIYALGTKNTDYSVDFANGLFQTVTTGSGAATVTIADWGSASQSVSAWLYIQQGATARVQTLSGNIKSSDALLNTTLPNSGNNALDAFELTWDGTHWFVSNALFAISHA